jgi:hypothetical protein
MQTYQVLILTGLAVIGVVCIVSAWWHSAARRGRTKWDGQTDMPDGINSYDRVAVESRDALDVVEGPAELFRWRWRDPLFPHPKEIGHYWLVRRDG